jgi:cytochrome c-type biogenesis protein CcmF
VAVIAGIAVPTVVYGGNSALTAAGVAAGLWLVLSALADPVRAILKRGPAVTRSALGMNVAHLGLGLFVLGVTVTSSFTIETDQKISPGGTATVGDYTIRFDSLREVQGPNYQALQGTMTIQRGDRIVATVYPEKRAYFVRSQPMTEAGIDGTIGRDLFVALGDDLGAGAWSVRIQYKPLIRFIWLGCLIMAAGGLLAATDRRYRFAREREPAAPASGELATGAAGS